MKNAFIDASTGVLKAYGYVDGNQEGDVLVEVDDDFFLEPGKFAFLEGQWVEYVKPIPVPKSVTMRQARLALLGAGILSGVDTAIDALPSPQKEQARIEWDYSSEVFRDKQLVGMMTSALGLTDEQVDQLFIAASNIP
jgi:hypothetical protein